MSDKRRSVAIALSAALQADDLAEFRKEAERIRPGMSGAWIVLADENGQQLVNIARPGGEALPQRNPNSTELQREATRAREVRISNVGH